MRQVDLDHFRLPDVSSPVLGDDGEEFLPLMVHITRQGVRVSNHMLPVTDRKAGRDHARGRAPGELNRANANDAGADLINRIGERGRRTRPRCENAGQPTRKRYNQ